jgi:hypothetical protein
MRTQQLRFGKLAAGILVTAAFLLATRPVAGQGLGSTGMSGGGFGGSSGGGFGGSSAGGGFLGSSSGSGGGFSGSSSSSGFTGSSGSTGSYRSGTSGTGTGSSTNQVVPQPSDLFQGYYVNPYRLGLATTNSSMGSLNSSSSTTGSGTNRTSSQGGFGQPLYGTTKTPTTTTTGTTSSVSSAGSTGFNTVGTRRAPAYTTTLGFTFAQGPGPVASPGGMQIKLGDVLQRSTMLPGRDLQVVIAGSTVILRGQVADDNQRRLAEGMIRLEPGVREVVNQIRVAPPAPGLRMPGS